MAIWQADYTVEAPSSGFPADLEDRLARIAAPMESWSRELRLFGVGDGHRIDLWRTPGSAPEVTFRIDLRSDDLRVARALVQLIADIGARIRDEAGDDVPPEWGAMQASLRRSRAYRFVKDPRAYLSQLRTEDLDAD